MTIYTLVRIYTKFFVLVVENVALRLDRRSCGEPSVDELQFTSVEDSSRNSGIRVVTSLVGVIVKLEEWILRGGWISIEL